MANSLRIHAIGLLSAVLLLACGKAQGQARVGPTDLRALVFEMRVDNFDARQQAGDALQKLGASAVPELTRWLHAEDSTLTKLLAGVAEEFTVPGYDWHGYAASALGEIGAPAASAAADLEVASREVLAQVSPEHRDFVTTRTRAALIKIRGESSKLPSASPIRSSAYSTACSTEFRSGEATICIAMGMQSTLRFEKVVVHVVHAYDVGLSIDLARAKQSITDLTELAPIRHKGHAPAYFQFDPPPLRVTQAIAPLKCGPYSARPEADVVVYDFGGASVGYEIDFSGSFEELIGLSCELVESCVFRDDSRARLQHLLEVIKPAVTRANIDAFSEGYLVFRIARLPAELTLDEFATIEGPSIARLLRSEADALSEQEIADALASRVAFGRKDQAWIDWNAALLVDEEPEDVLSVLEFANLQLLELRFLDGRLDRALDRSYELMSANRSWTRLRLPGSARAELRAVAQLQVDAAILHERVNNALKLLGDQYLARVYRATSARFRLAEWNSGILRKLETIESIYSKVHDHATQIRMEILEWIIIALIAFELVLPFFD